MWKHLAISSSLVFAETTLDFLYSVFPFVYLNPLFELWRLKSDFRKRYRKQNKGTS